MSETPTPVPAPRINVNPGYIDHAGQKLPAARISRDQWYVFVPMSAARYIADRLHDLADAYDETNPTTKEDNQ